MKKRYVVKYQEFGKWYIYDKLLKKYIAGKDELPLIFSREEAWIHARYLKNTQIAKTLKIGKEIYQQIIDKENE